MRRTDFTLPWGREDTDNIITHLNAEKEYKTHRTYLANATSVLDTSDPPSRLELTDMFDSGKSAQLRRDRQRQIDIGNQKMVEKMADTLRKGGPTMNPSYPSRPYERRTEGSSTITRRRETAKIDAQNKILAQRLRHDIKPEIDHRKQAAEYDKASALRRNISLAHKRSTRAHHEQNRRDALEAAATLASQAMSDGLMGRGGGGEGGSVDNDGDAGFGVGGGGDSGGGGGGGPVLMGLGSSSRVTGLTSIRTAADVRARVAAERGDALPDWLISSKSTVKTSQQPSSSFADPNLIGESRSKSQHHVKSTHMMTHMGAPPAPVLAMPPFPM